jgi:sensor histidine kinase regulating citrate/malate metabolism
MEATTLLLLMLCVLVVCATLLGWVAWHQHLRLQHLQTQLAEMLRQQARLVELTQALHAAVTTNAEANTQLLAKQTQTLAEGLGNVQAAVKQVDATLNETLSLD